MDECSFRGECETHFVIARWPSVASPLFVPQGRLKIAHRFNGGWPPRAQQTSPARDDRISRHAATPPVLADSVVPVGAEKIASPRSHR